MRAWTSTLLALLVMALLLACTRDGDGDGDGHLSDVDCDDADPARHPGAEERCDGADQDCDGVVDEDAIDASVWYADGDGDGVGSEGSAKACEAPPGHVAEAGDCDDADPARYPGAEDVPLDEIDQDCDGEDALPPKPRLLVMAEERLVAEGYEGSFVFQSRGYHCCDPPPGRSLRPGMDQPSFDLEADSWVASYSSELFVSGNWRLKGDVVCWRFEDQEAREAAADKLERYRIWYLSSRTFKIPTDTWSRGRDACAMTYASLNREPFAQAVARALDVGAEAEFGP